MGILNNWRVEARKRLTEPKHESARPPKRKQPSQTKRKQPGQTKNQAKVRAGKKGAQQRWLNDLAWHRGLERLRGGFGGESWRVRGFHALFRYVCLWRANKCKLPPDAQQELAAIGAELSFQMLRNVVGHGGKPLLHMKLTHTYIRYWLNVTPQEDSRLRARLQPTPKVKPPSPRAQTRASRFYAVCIACDWLHRNGYRVTVAAVQKRLAASGIEASRSTVHSDLKKIAR